MKKLYTRIIGKKQLRQLLAWSFSNDSMQACALADLKYLGFKYASRLGFQSVSKI
jgi:hypothetical protein